MLAAEGNSALQSTIGAQQPPARPSLVDGRYRIEHLLGEGGMGSVYQVHDEGAGQRLALKRLHGEPGSKHAELFEREYRTLASLRHPRIVEVFDYGVDKDGPYYTMELLEGFDLSRRAPMSFRAACACLRDAASLLGVLHSRRLVHRDLSPRNLWQTSDGRLKLLDFGALAPFGPAVEVVGTPAFVAPEALSGKPLDQRSDLFALGALGYWLLTSTHAFRANQLAELPRVWAKAPASPSSLAKLVQGADPHVPPELDRLIESLLRLDPDERPRNTGEVIDRLNTIAGLIPEAEDVIVEGYLESKVFVGRKSERERCSRALRQANQGTPQALCVEGPEGIGRSRLLVELATAARLSGATVLVGGAGAAGRPYETAITLARELLLALPHEGRDAAHAHASVLAGLSAELRTRLGNPSRSTPSINAIEERARRQNALADWLLSVARQRTLVVLIDDLHAADEESQALLSTLARAEPGHRLLLICSLDSHSALSDQSTVRAFVSSARKLRLSPLSVPEMHEMLRSVFGDVPYLERLAARLHQISDGNPGHAWLLARHLVHHGSARYAEGAWMLPTDLPTDLPSTLKNSLLAALESLPPEARHLARLASVPGQGALTRAMLATLADEPAADLERTLKLLLEQRLLRETDDGLQLAHPALRETLRAELSPSQHTRAHRLLGELFDQQADLLSRVHSGLHFMKAGDHAAGEARLLAASRRIMAGEHEGMRGAAVLFAEALALSRLAARGEYAQLPLLSVLGVAGYQVDRSYAVLYGDDAVAALSRVLRFDLARRLRPFLGNLPSLLVALMVTAIAMRWRRAGTRPLEAITWLITVLGYLMGPAAMSLDHTRLRAYARVFQPLLALGQDHGVALVYRFCKGLVVSLEDRCADSQRSLLSVIDRLNQPGQIRSLPEANRRNLISAAYYTYGTRETFACDDHVLVTADALDQGTPMHQLQADQLRAIHYSYRGETARAAGYDQRVERKAIQLGTAWQAELVSPRHLARIALWTCDLALHKRALRALTRLAQDIPSFARSVQRARGADLVLRGKHREALQLLELPEEPQAELGWMAAQALLAAAYNGLGQHAQAKAVCETGLARLSEADRDFVIQNLPAEVELALAEAGLGAFQNADQALIALLERHASRGPLILGYLHRARVRVALLAHELEAAGRHLDAMDGCYRPTRIPSLLILSVELRHELQRAQTPGPNCEAPLTADDAHLLTRVELLMRSTTDNLDDHAGRSALQVALELTGADRGTILYAHGNSPAISLGMPAGQDVLEWARGLLQSAEQEEDRTAALWDDLETLEDLNVRQFGAVFHCVSVMWRVHGEVDRPVAALVLGSESEPPTPPPAGVLRVMGERLLRSRQ